MIFDASGLNRAFRRMEDKAKSKGKTLAEDQSRFFLAMLRKLGWLVAPTKEKLDEIGQFFGNRLKRKKGKTPEQEIERRKRARGTFARGWRFWKSESSGFRIRIWMWNPVKYSGTVDERKKVSEKAANIVGSGFKKRLDKLASQITGAFNG